MRFLALLRGVNVGGKNLLDMPSLRTALTDAGYDAVSTYINSGNILFSSECSDVLELQRGIADVIHERFGISVPVGVFSAAELIAAASAIPSWWGVDPDAKHNAIFVVPPTQAAEVLEAVGAARPEYESVAASGRVIFWTATRATISRSRWMSITKSAAYRAITIRNDNTFRKLVALVQL